MERAPTATVARSTLGSRGRAAARRVRRVWGELGKKLGSRPAAATAACPGPRRGLAVAPSARDRLDAEKRCVYVKALETLRESAVEFMVGGAHALAPYAGIVRDTKDLDIFLRRSDCETALAALRAAGFATELTFSHWLAKAHSDDHSVDLIFSSGNGVAPVDDDWFTHAVAGRVFGVPTLLCPPEEMIWSKAFIMERERYDGADVAHLLLACGARLDWQRLLARFGRHWRVLLSHLVL